MEESCLNCPGVAPRQRRQFQDCYYLYSSLGHLSWLVISLLSLSLPFSVPSCLFHTGGITQRVLKAPPLVSWGKCFSFYKEVVFLNHPLCSLS